jgi:cytochrome c
MNFRIMLWLIAMLGPAVAGSPEAGRQDFRSECSICHSPVQGTNRTGPSLFGVVGRRTASVPGFNYSQGNQNSHLTWTDDELNKYLLSPRCVVPGTKMTFTGIKDDTKRADVISYLDTLK